MTDMPIMAITIASVIHGPRVWTRVGDRRRRLAHSSAGRPRKDWAAKPPPSLRKSRKWLR
jgi:hypothetical protein